MARRSAVGRRPESGLRAAMIERTRHLVDTQTARVECEDGFFISPWPRLLADLEAGRAVEVCGFQIPVQYRPRGSVSARVRLTADDRIEPARPPA
ncbi:hypothetical protein [Rhodococcus sp. H29-C3]|uniref:hypothetical protein n=1 Tax=Rhodococcus sp. H29-C3 TaxID=3046307 RepID=UPI0024B9D9E2|nr:hypothetical protein [Rhodococcus sp. H29-C3]MDJ0359696.1 hypothetical protein [Rhodococcus sp. H29-C3]